MQAIRSLTQAPITGCGSLDVQCQSWAGVIWGGELGDGMMERFGKWKGREETSELCENPVETEGLGDYERLYEVGSHIPSVRNLA